MKCPLCGSESGTKIVLGEEEGLRIYNMWGRVFERHTVITEEEESIPEEIDGLNNILHDLIFEPLEIPESSMQRKR